MPVITIPLRFQYLDGIWVAQIATSFGPMEIIVGGKKDEPDAADLEAVEQFLHDATATLRRVRSQLPWGFLYRPIRIALNSEHRVGIQFRHRFTGSQAKLIFA